MKKVLKWFFIGAGALFTLVLIVGIGFLNLSPQFGGEYTAEDVARLRTSKNFTKDGHFVNLEPTKTAPSFGDVGKMLSVLTADVPGLRPTEKLPVQNISGQELQSIPTKTRVIWFGHSAFLLEIGGKRILIDPMLSDVPAPHPWLGGERFTKKLPIAIENLPKIDAVILSHDHYDHLDYETIQRIKNKVSKYFVPLGVGAHLQAWGVDKKDIVELDWWEETTFDDLILTATPARHFSGRGLSDSKKTLWASWIIRSAEDNIYFSGDSGYGSHFKAIGEKYGPFDLALMECGQYNDSLPEFAIHMLPEETAQAGLDVRAEYIMPIHWGSFSLNAHPWKEPVERLTVKATELELNMITPVIGQIVELNQLESSAWWKDYQ